ncbi:MAG: biopolymer transporter ExbD [Bacteroidales bacterium]|jgi:biopolymer transport protein ExbD|nr:biopolymer transporter ExbD [Bacteroidales bacterium]MDT8372673.1 biopolymer transporter ExbD [Bacteroidales bacterium]MDX9904261.1 biopolymer transporter ExbD [Bacteroidales bacterium]
MAITTKNKVSVNFSSAGMSDIVFLLLLFFMLTSTLVQPTAIKLLLPKGTTQTSARPMTTVSITRDLQYFIEDQPIMLENLESALQAKVGSNPEIYISLHTDRSVPVEYVVNVMNIAAKNQYKLILATTPK